MKASFDHDLTGIRTALDDLAANFATPGAQGPQAYVAQMTIDHPELEPKMLATDAVVGLEEFLLVLSVR